MKLGYVILYVSNVDRSLTFYENAFGFERRFFSEEDGKSYGELDTGEAILSFANYAQAQSCLNSGITTTATDELPLSFEVAFVTDDVSAAFAKACDAGAIVLREPEEKPWGQMVAYVRDCDGHTVELCTPMS